MLKPLLFPDQVFILFPFVDFDVLDRSKFNSEDKKVNVFMATDESVRSLTTVSNFVATLDY